ncbi:MAG: M48 family metallopeptidase [Myxococcota bacterium]
MSAWLRRSLVPLACAGFTCPALVAPAASNESDLSAFNLFSVEQDIEIGRQSAAEAELKLVLLDDPSVDAYLSRIVRALAAQTPGASYPYSIKTVDDPTINAYSLPGGPMYANRGLVTVARSEAELAGVIAHEMAHIALRHGTNQASKAYLANAGLGVLGGLLGNSGGDTAQMLASVGGLGLNAVFLKFSRNDEYQADRLGAEIMAPAGYDPIAMADFFALLRAQNTRDPGSLENFFSSHPPAAEREGRIRAQAASLARKPAFAVGGFDTVVARLQRLPASSSRAAAPLAQQPRAVDVASSPPIASRIAAPSTHFETFEHGQGFFAIEHPANWKAYASRSGYATTIAPEGGIVATSKGEQSLVYGVAINHYVPFEGGARRGSGKRSSLANATDDLVAQVLRSNPYLREAKGGAKRERVGKTAARSVTLSGRSPVTGENERVVIFTRGTSDDHVLYGLLVAPERDYATVLPAFLRMMRSLEVHDSAQHS